VEPNDLAQYFMLSVPSTVAQSNTLFTTDLFYNKRLMYCLPEAIMLILTIPVTEPRFLRGAGVPMRNQGEHKANLRGIIGACRFRAVASATRIRAA
jgi:hypothetical protein